MTDQTFPVSAAWAKKAWVDDAKYQDMYRQSVDDPAAFWGEQGQRLHWFTPYTKVRDVSYAAADLHRSEEHTSELQSH